MWIPVCPKETGTPHSCMSSQQGWQVGNPAPSTACNGRRRHYPIFTLASLRGGRSYVLLLFFPPFLSIDSQGCCQFLSLWWEESISKIVCFFWRIKFLVFVLDLFKILAFNAAKIVFSKQKSQTNYIAFYHLLLLSTKIRITFFLHS